MNSNSVGTYSISVLHPGIIRKPGLHVFRDECIICGRRAFRFIYKHM
jgi:hypothetical protein